MNHPRTPRHGSRARLLDAATRYSAEHGLADRSLREIATKIGTSHRMLIYHFGSREGLLAAIVDRIEQDLLASLQTLMARAELSPLDQGLRFWEALTDSALRYGPLFFELAAAAMRGAPHAEHVPRLAVRMWLEPLTTLWRRAGADPERAPVLARLGLDTANGLLLDLLLTGDAAAARDGMAMFVDTVVAREITAP